MWPYMPTIWPSPKLLCQSCHYWQFQTCKRLWLGPAGGPLRGLSPKGLPVCAHHDSIAAAIPVTGTCLCQLSKALQSLKLPKCPDTKRSSALSRQHVCHEQLPAPLDARPASGKHLVRQAPTHYTTQQVTTKHSATCTLCAYQ